MAVFPPTDWGDWTPEEYQVGAPATALHFERWFRNVVAAFQGAVDAPSLSLLALGQPTAGNEVRMRADATVTGGSNAVLRPLVFGSLQKGQVRIELEHQSTTGGTFKVSRIRGGTKTDLASWGTSGWTYRVIDVGIVPGDLIEVTGTMASAGGASGSMRNVRLKTGGEDIVQAFSGEGGTLEGNTYNA